MHVRFAGCSLTRHFCSHAVREIGLKYGLGAGELCNEWVAFSKQHDDCDMNAESVERWENQVTKHLIKLVTKHSHSMWSGNQTSDLFCVFWEPD